MWFNSTQREEPYLGLNRGGPQQKRCFFFGNSRRGAAWLSSARVVRCWVKSRNERNPRSVLLALFWAGLAGDRQRQVGGRWGRRQVIMAFMSRATHVLQWAVQRVAKPRGGANP